MVVPLAAGLWLSDGISVLDMHVECFVSNYAIFLSGSSSVKCPKCNPHQDFNNNLSTPFGIMLAFCNYAISDEDQYCLHSNPQGSLL